MKEYISLLKQGCKIQTFILWWILRALMLFAFVFNFTAESFTLSGQIHIAVCFVASFGWEMSMAMGKKSLFSLIPSSIHTIINAGLAASAVLGVAFNMYYTVRLFDPLLQAFFGFVSVLYGYEIAYAMVKRDRFSATKAMVFYAAFGVSYIFFNVCELGEFFSDQLLGVLSGTVGNSQFWSAALAESTGRAEAVIPAIDITRYPLMDIMADVVIHTVSAFAALILINVYPYRLKGKYKYDVDFGNNDVKTPETEKN